MFIFLALFVSLDNAVTWLSEFGVYMWLPVIAVKQMCKLVHTFQNVRKWKWPSFLIYAFILFVIEHIKVLHVTYCISSTVSKLLV